LDYILEDHKATVEEFQREVNTLHGDDIKQWIASTLPILVAHREKARQVKYSMQTNP
jgi:hypothetical protein